ncbi:Major Facilitator Superfamily (MFS) [Achlya hypogyna]|uniref:Hexose transporter 1 n=1 Tax=Achlya hypogyna TaxID=1202772 RepID=A0A1V9YIZ1_ACHHY|nr:Major Facilitator Superfamily (MFS) [Achlya hypogyna]
MAGGIALVTSGGAHDAPTEGSRAYAIVVCVFASLGGIFFGYDQGVTGGVLVMQSFLDSFCIGYDGNTDHECKASSDKLPNNWSTFTTLFNVLYYLGCIFGAYIGGVIADKFGRRATIFSAGILFCAGTLMLVLTNQGGHTLALIARIIQGFGVGNSSFSLPIFGAEMAPKELRGMLSGFMQMSIVTGLLLAGIINYVVQDDKHGWRVTNAVAMAFPVVVMLGIFCVPESPRWLYKAKGRDVAEKELKRLRRTENVSVELQAIGDALEEEGNDSATWADIWHPSIRPRLIIACLLQLLQQATGINPIFTYGGQIFKDVVGDGLTSLLILQIVNFISTIPAMYWVDQVGRRKLLLLGAVGMVIGHLVSAIAFTAGCHGNTEDSGCSKGAGWTMIVFCAFFIFNFAISWGPVCWIYPAEIFPMNVRAKAVSASTMTNWCMGALMIGIPKLFKYLNINGVFFLFAALCTLAGTYVWFKCPETKGVLLEDIEYLFGGAAAPKTVDGIVTPPQHSV